MRKAILAVAVALLMAAGTAWAQQGPPQPGPEHKKVAHFAGTWNFEGETKASPWGPAGKVTWTEKCEMFEGGFALICRSEGKSPTGPTKMLSIMSYDADKKMYTYTAAESGAPVFTAHGKTDAGTWNWSTESTMGGKPMKTRVTITEEGPNTYTMKMELSTDGGPYTTLMEGKATRGSTS